MCLVIFVIGEDAVGTVIGMRYGVGVLGAPASSDAVVVAVIVVVVCAITRDTHVGQLYGRTHASCYHANPVSGAVGAADQRQRRLELSAAHLVTELSSGPSRRRQRWLTDIA